MTSTTFEAAEDYAEALEAAATSGNVEQATSLMKDWKACTTVESPNDELLCVPADLAAQNGHPATLDILLENGAEPSQLLAATAAKSASPEVFQVLYDHGWRPDHVGIQDKMPVIIRAVGSRPVLEWLLDHGADANAVSPWNSTALSHAAALATPEEVDLLLARGARLEGSNALHGAADRQCSEDEAKSLAMMQHLLDLGIDINAIETQHVPPKRFQSTRYGPQGRGTALIKAVRAGKVARVEWLLGHGADVNVKVEGTRSALQWAEHEGHEEIATLLRQHGAWVLGR
ncbi:hypothetical protein LTR36_010899 [Oleoguttula mirabilis]|uniref:Uncharacterized protein n=1 Tax=Oleoguttula mirabilis TaxID=1507867 RepID=A0AAV9J4F7_9PEZI|nr:hypothetical protein LTR36_010899 [Oleoguttula mirabilis]